MRLLALATLLVVWSSIVAAGPPQSPKTTTRAATTRVTTTTTAVPTPPGSGKKCTPSPRTRLTIMTFNIYDGGSSLLKVAQAIRAADADLVGLQEVHAEGVPCTADICDPANDTSAAYPLADLVGFKYVYEQTKKNDAIWANAIISRFPLSDPTPNDLGVRVHVPGGRTVYAFNLHLDDAPYQPYQALGIEYGDWPYTNKSDELVCWATLTRGPSIDLLEKDINSVKNLDAAFLFGDFNEPSHLDWTDAAVRIGLHPLAVPFPTSRMVASLGFVDTYRTKYPSVVEKPGLTWTPTTAPDDLTDHHDRIDFVYAKSKTLIVHDVGIVGEKKPDADIIVTPWPSDHRSVFARVSF
ncbi:DNase I-like protein [Gonapodya prolifera JEL478]|uniref:DNase I-like protein n=1 Tax=Gonapodya prolifera (strain JEL478) TaxID=1344416 RepID=A0A139A9M8_GONPJ|nr:DNase I-like protein [Gonapodya prolifera JEL478]|eukprot:KXS13103.1 DNase I-like protein [Gonapodya prolifera JEL478]